MWGPLGNGFPPAPTEHLLMVAGGIGQTPFLALAREYLGLRVYGDPPRQVPRRERSRFATASAAASTWPAWTIFAALGVDGATEHRRRLARAIAGFVTASDPARGRAIGLAVPHRLLRSGGDDGGHGEDRPASWALPCQVSLESPMACGIGICFSCVKKIRDAAGGWDYRRTCVEGPVFDAADVEF